MNSLRLALLIPMVVSLTPACIIVDHENPGCIGDECGTLTGDIQFYWSFELFDGSVTDSCLLADVARVEIQVYDDYGNLEFSTSPDRPCEDFGATITNFYPGLYQLEVTGVCSTGVLTHQGFFTLEVYEDQVNDYGSLILDYVRPCL